MKTHLRDLVANIRLSLIKWLAGSDLQVAINCKVRGELILKRGYPGRVTNCFFVPVTTKETQSDYADLVYQEYARLMGITARED